MKFRLLPLLLLLLAVPAAVTAQDAGLTNLWSFNLGSRYSQSSPALAPDGTLYTGTLHGWLIALTPDGKLKWKFKTGRQIKSSPAVGADGTIYFGSRDKNFYALSPSGKLKWKFAAGAWVDSSPAIAADGTVCFGSWDGNFYALSPDGKLKWKFATGGIIDSSPAIGADGTVYFGSHDKDFYALNSGGSLKWKLATGGEIASSPAIGADGAVYFTSADGIFYAFNADGAERWRRHTGGGTAASPVLDEAGNFCLGVNQDVCGFTAGGILRWSFHCNYPVETSAMALGGGMIFSAEPFSSSGVLDGDGKFTQLFPVGFGFYSAANVHSSGVICLADEGYARTWLPWKKTGAAIQTLPVTLAKSSWPMWRANPRHTGRVEK